LTKYDFEKSELIADYDDLRKGIMNKKILGAPTPILFEGKELWGVEYYDVYLKQKYGDYMQIPDVNKQRQHNFHLLDLNKSYKEYKNK
jgi:lipopolysaccharide cholinephosphotransferase